MRTKKGAARTRAKRRLFKRTKGYRGGRNNLRRTAKETLIRADVFAYRDRRLLKRDYRRLWITRISAATAMRGLSYSRFMAQLKAANIMLNRKMLSEIAIADPQGFDLIVEQAKPDAQ